MNSKRILHISTFDEGGAGNAAYQFHELCLKLGYESKFLSKYNSYNKKGNNFYWVAKKLKKKGIHFFTISIQNQFIKLIKFIKIGKLNPKYLFINIDEEKELISTKKLLQIINFEPEIIFLYFISDFFVSKNIKEIKDLTNAQIFWLMMDNAPLTGGCHYPWECKGFENDCSNCPAILFKCKKKTANNNMAIKKCNLSNVDLIALSTSDLKRAYNSVIFNKRKIHHFLLPIDETKYHPGSSPTSRLFFNIPINKKVIFFGASQVNDKRKGIILLLDALKRLYEENTFLDDDTLKYHILISGGGNGFTFEKLCFEYSFVGYLSENQLIEAYRAADVFVCPSIEDSGPIMINQSIMCGTPVVAFEMGVALDLVHTGQTGYRAKLGDTADLAKGIRFVLGLNKYETEKMKGNCRELGLKLCSSGTRVKKLIESFNTNL